MPPEAPEGPEWHSADFDCSQTNFQASRILPKVSREIVAVVKYRLFDAWYTEVSKCTRPPLGRFRNSPNAGGTFPIPSWNKKQGKGFGHV
jgi:hypothetical protein